MAEIIGYCPDCKSEIFDIDEEFMITGETTGAFECSTCGKMQPQKDIMKYPECANCKCCKCPDDYCKTEACYETCTYYGKAFPYNEYPCSDCPLSSH